MRVQNGMAVLGIVAILDSGLKNRYNGFVVVTVDIEKSKQVSEWIKQVQAGNEVLLTQGNKPVAKLIAAPERTASADAPFEIRPLKGHRVLTPNISRAEIAEEMFGQK